MILVTWREEGDWELYQGLKARFERVEILQPFWGKDPRKRLWQRLSTRLSYFYVPVMAFYRRKGFHAVISWSMRMGICYGIINRLWGGAYRPRHILRDFHIDLTRHDLRYRLKLKTLPWALPGIDYFLCTSREEETIYSRMFNISAHKICFFPDTPSADLFEYPDFARNDYIFACGNSDRDFDVLIEAVRGFKAKTIILSQKYQPQPPLPDNVEIITHRIAEHDLMALIGAARLVVLPLNAYRVAAGQNTMIEAMALGRPLVVTSNMATVEYAVHAETAFFCAAKDASGLARHIRYLWEHPGAAEKMGRRARDAIRLFADKEITILSDVLERFFPDSEK